MFLFFSLFLLVFILCRFHWCLFKFLVLYGNIYLPLNQFDIFFPLVIFVFFCGSLIWLVFISSLSPLKFLEVYIVITVLKFLSANSKICQSCYFFQPCVNAKHFNLWSIWMVLPFIRKFSHSHAVISTLLYTLRRHHRSLQLSLCTGFSSLVFSPVNSVLDFPWTFSSFPLTPIICVALPVFPPNGAWSRNSHKEISSWLLHLFLVSHMGLTSLVSCF